MRGTKTFKSNTDSVILSVVCSIMFILIHTTNKMLAHAATDAALENLYIYPSFQWHTQEFFWGGVQQIQLRTERTGIWGCSPLVRGSGGSCNLVQEISFHIVKFS